MDDPSAWLAEDFQGKEDSFTYHFTEQDLREIRAAVAKVKAKGLRIEVNSLRPIWSFRSYSVHLATVGA